MGGRSSEGAVPGSGAPGGVTSRSGFLIGWIRGFQRSRGQERRVPIQVGVSSPQPIPPHPPLAGPSVFCDGVRHRGRLDVPHSAAGQV